MNLSFNEFWSAQGKADARRVTEYNMEPRGFKPRSHYSEAENTEARRIYLESFVHWSE
jgi:hypothetical protein